MRILSMLGLSGGRILALNRQTTGVVSDVQTCWWISIKGAPCGAANARHPHYVRFSYIVDGKCYAGSRFIGWKSPVPAAGQRFCLFYDPDDPKKYAIQTF